MVRRVHFYVEIWILYTLFNSFFFKLLHLFLLFLFLFCARIYLFIEKVFKTFCFISILFYFYFIFQILSVTNSTFSDNLLRLASFASFPRSCPLYFSRLSSAGFTYTGKDDIVSCSACDLHIGNWNGKEIPLLVHRQNSPSCPMIKGLLVNTENQYSNNKSLQCAEDVSKVMETSDFEKCKSTDSAKEFQQSTKKATDHWRKSDKATDHWRKSDRTSFDSTGSDNNIDGLDGGHSYESGYISQSPVSAENISSPSIIPYSSPRYPHNAILCERLKTFNTWSRDMPQSPENLARAGFFYTGTYIFNPYKTPYKPSDTYIII